MRKSERRWEKGRNDGRSDRLVTSLFRHPERTARAGIHFVDRNHYLPLRSFFLSRTLPPLLFLSLAHFFLSTPSLATDVAALKPYG